MIFSQRDRFTDRRRRHSIDGRETSVFVPPSTLVAVGAPRIVDQWVNHESLKQKQLDVRSYNVSGTLLNRKKGVTITPRRNQHLSNLDMNVPGPAVYHVPAPPIIKKSFNRATFHPVLPAKEIKRPVIPTSPRFRGAYNNASSPQRDLVLAAELAIEPSAASMPSPKSDPPVAANTVTATETETAKAPTKGITTTGVHRSAIAVSVSAPNTARSTPSAPVVAATPQAPQRSPTKSSSSASGSSSPSASPSAIKRPPAAGTRTGAEAWAEVGAGARAGAGAGTSTKEIRQLMRQLNAFLKPQFQTQPLPQAQTQTQPRSPSAAPAPASVSPTPSPVLVST